MTRRVQTKRKMKFRISLGCDDDILNIRIADRKYQSENKLKRALYHQSTVTGV